MNKINSLRRKIYLRKIQKKNINKNFTLISQNCIGGLIYKDLNLQFLSPTINMFIEDDNFVKLIKKPQYYFSLSPTPLIEKYIDPIDNNVCFPKIQIGDIEICCQHYNSCQHAIDDWNRRRLRVNLDNIFVIANTWNLHYNPELINEVLSCKYKTILFSDIKMDDDRCVFCDKGFKLDKRGILRPNLTDFIPNSPYKYFEKMFDFVEWINKDEK